MALVGSGGAAARLRRTSESHTVVPVAWGKPHQEHRHGQVSVGVEMEGSASRRLTHGQVRCLLAAGTTAHASERRQGGRGGTSA